MSVHIQFKGSTYALATTLRVAYVIQGQHNHMPYSEVFNKLGEMPIEQQIDILYAAFKCANPEALVTQQEFRDYYLDNCSLKEMMEQLKAVFRGISGQTEKATSENEDDGEDSGN